MLYLDTSVVVALLATEPFSPAVVAWYDQLQEPPVSSDWLLPEFASAISIKVRTGQLAEAHAKAVRKEFDALVSGGIRLAPVTRSAFSTAATMAQAHKDAMRAGDALHVAVAGEIGATVIATLDDTMAAYAKRLKMQTVDFS